jgi:ATP-dependent DNA helicase RecQ
MLLTSGAEPMTTPAAPLLSALKRSFGFSSFRPLQEEIVRDALDGRDVFALLPTGGGKSLCFQLPAVVRPGLTLVVSPLIALMKDQVDALTTAGIPSTFLNSSLAPLELAARSQGLREGRYRLLYVAPERLQPGFFAELRQLRVEAIVVDEAHCISAWGHDFRPDYRRLSALCEAFPEAPIMALTATATPRVQQDILDSLRLRSPRVHVASFNRPNLYYRIEAKDHPYRQLLAFVRGRPGECGIVYGQSRRTAARLAEKLASDGVSAVAYHAGLSPAERARAHDAFSRDDVRVVCATVAFGMGINKPNVRFVVHFDLPKNLESYYQETGRAGRDGLPSECLFLFAASDAAKQRHFIAESPDREQRAEARQKLDAVVQYAESTTCRRATLLAYFGEQRPPGPCGGCDNCTAPRQAYDGTLSAQKFLSCVLRIQQKSGVSAGMRHVVAVLVGANSQRIRAAGHHEISTYGIGKEHDRKGWQLVGRELLQLGLLRQSEESHGALEVTEQGRATLKTRAQVLLMTHAPQQPQRQQPEQPTPEPGGLPCDEHLLESLRVLRKSLADARDVPPHNIFSDVALRQMAREYPTEVAAFSRISGVVEKKLADFGEAFMKAIAAHTAEHGRERWGDDRPPPPPAAPLNDTTRDTLRRFREGHPPAAIALDRGLAQSTIIGHLASAAEAGEPVDLDGLLTREQQLRVVAVFAELGTANLTGALERLGDGITYGQLRVARAVLPPPPTDPPPTDPAPSTPAPQPATTQPVAASG